MEGIKLEQPLLGETFLRLLGSSLSEEQLMALSPLERGLYVVCKFKLGQWIDTGFTSYLNRDGSIKYGGPLIDVLFTVLDHQVGSESRHKIVEELYEGSWLAGDRKLAKSDNVITLLVAMLIFREGGWVEYDGVIHRNHLPS